MVTLYHRQPLDADGGIAGIQPRPQPPKTTRLTSSDCGLINVNRAGTERYKVTPEEVGETRFSVPCFLVVTRRVP
jgi:hypothetical protein